MLLPEIPEYVKHGTYTNSKHKEQKRHSGYHSLKQKSKLGMDSKFNLSTFKPPSSMEEEEKHHTTKSHQIFEETSSSTSSSQFDSADDSSVSA